MSSRRSRKGRKHDRDDVEPIEQVFAKCAVANGATEVAMRGRDDADIHLDLLRRADRTDGTALEHVEQLRLQRRRHLADLVEEQGATVGLGEEAGAIGRRARERTFDVSKELALEELFRQRGAVEGNERSTRPLTVRVEGACDEALSGSRFAQNDHRRRARRRRARCARARPGLRGWFPGSSTPRTAFGERSSAPTSLA